jgi:phosphatidylserine/phosphatidylglycerophosphate/cardiolipin synthase-like enzyme
MRFFNGCLHIKSMMIDHQLLIINSHNFHYSSISEGGLNEFHIVIDGPGTLGIYQVIFEDYWKYAISVDAAK